MKKLVSLAALLAMVLVAAGSAALAQVSQEEPETEPTTELGVLGFITSISGTEVRVEEDPQDPVFGGSGSDKGSFTVTGQTEILRQQGEELIPAAFGDLKVGQLVAATYTGPVLESYPSQGGVGSIVILEEPLADDDQLLCLLPEGCDTDGDGMPDLVAGEPVPGEGLSTGLEQYGNAA